ncbi:MAG: GIY-YIG nuclease family protein [Chloroflexi bacterium]|nr:GIY-YIG nuclease family protein [Chloroflexota bacterium]
MNQYYVYILSSYRGTLYVGMTSNLVRRLEEHRHGVGGDFTKRYTISRLVYYETTEDVLSAITREKQLKGWTRAKKAALIEASNPYWVDLADQLT